MSFWKCHVDKILTDISRRLDIMDQKLSSISGKLDYIICQENQEMVDLSALQAQVERTTTIDQSAITLIQGLAAQIAAAGTDPVKLQELQDQLHNSTEALAAAITANTAPPTA